MTDTLDRVRKIIFDQLNVEPSEVQMDSSIVDDLNADSLDIVELVMAVENEFDVTIADEEAEKIKTVGQIVNYIDNYKK